MPRKPNLYDFFNFGQELGSGTFATVYKVTENATGKVYAMKVIDKAQSKGMEGQIVKEITILKKIKHNNIIRLYECFETREKIYMQMEYVDGGELFDRIVNMGYYGENDAKNIVNGILEAVHYLHMAGIVHRDLKPENLLMSSKEDPADVKLADFGLSSIASNDSMLKTSCGTLTYCAPEILRGDTYGKAVDMWSIGVITYILLSGYPPFWDKDENIMIDLTLRGQFTYFSPDWDEVSSAAKDFISSLICVDPKKRLTSSEALEHPWLGLEITTKTNLGKRVGTNLVKHFNAKQKIKVGVNAVKFINAIKHISHLAGVKSAGATLLAAAKRDAENDAALKSPADQDAPGIASNEPGSASSEAAPAAPAAAPQEAS